MTHHYRTPNSLLQTAMDLMTIGKSNFQIMKLSIQLFDRYGKAHQRITQNNSWDGTFNGHELPLQIIGLL
jgi:gliding motility-associated-like protein